MILSTKLKISEVVVSMRRRNKTILGVIINFQLHTLIMRMAEKLLKTFSKDTNCLINVP